MTPPCARPACPSRCLQTWQTLTRCWVSRLSLLHPPLRTWTRTRPQRTIWLSLRPRPKPSAMTTRMASPKARRTAPAQRACLLAQLALDCGCTWTAHRSKMKRRLTTPRRRRRPRLRRLPQRTNSPHSSLRPSQRRVLMMKTPTRLRMTTMRLRMRRLMMRRKRRATSRSQTQRWR